MRRTLLETVVGFTVGGLVVYFIWSPLSKLVVGIPPEVSGWISVGISFLYVFVMADMARKGVSTNGYRYLISYGVLCVLYALITLPASQYNTGTAVSSVAAVCMTLWTLVQKARTKPEDNKPKQAET
jgi:hypothetical protein